MADELSYRKDLFTGTAFYYERFRPPYPTALLEDLRDRVPLGPGSRMVDLACGTGQVALPLARYVSEVWAVDQEAELVELAGDKSERLGITNVRWIIGAAEDVALDGAFDLVTVGNAFHRLDREVVARRLIPHLANGGCVALLWSGTPWGGEEPWQRSLSECLARWQYTVGAHDRVPDRWEQVMERDPHERVLQRAGLHDEGRFEYSTVQTWTVEQLIGFVYSTSFLNRTVLGDHADAFATDLRRQLLDCRSDGVFEQELTFVCQLARH